MEKQKNKPKDRVEVGRISLVRWENSSGGGEVFTSFSLQRTVTKRNEDDPSKFEGQVFSLNGLTMRDLEAIKEAIEQMQEGRESRGWSQ